MRDAKLDEQVAKATASMEMPKDSNLIDGVEHLYERHGESNGQHR